MCILTGFSIYRLCTDRTTFTTSFADSNHSNWLDRCWLEFFSYKSYECRRRYITRLSRSSSTTAVRLSETLEIAHLVPSYNEPLPKEHKLYNITLNWRTTFTGVNSTVHFLRILSGKTSSICPWGVDCQDKNNGVDLRKRSALTSLHFWTLPSNRQTE